MVSIYNDSVMLRCKPCRVDVRHRHAACDTHTPSSSSSMGIGLASFEVLLLNDFLVHAYVCGVFFFFFYIIIVFYRRSLSLPFNRLCHYDPFCSSHFACGSVKRCNAHLLCCNYDLNPRVRNVQRNNTESESENESHTDCSVHGEMCGMCWKRFWINDG